MDVWKKVLKKLLFPPVWAVGLSSLSFPALIWIFLKGWQGLWQAIPVYVLSAYALTVVILWAAPPLAAFFRKRKEKQTAEEGKTPEERLRGLGKDLLKDMAVNLGFGLFYLFSAYRENSGWLFANGLYNLVQGMLYAIAAHYQHKLAKKYDVLLAWKGYTVLGWWLTALNLTMTGCVFLVIWRGESESYPGVLVFAVAALTFYKLIASIARLVRYRKSGTPLLGAACNAGHTEATMSLFMLQTALLSAFGQDFAHTKLMNTLTGTAVCLLTVLGAAGMVLHGRKRMREEASHGTKRVL